MAVERRGAWVVVALALGACTAKDESSPGFEAPDYKVQCTGECPANTRLAKSTLREVQDQGGVLFEKDGCTSTCVPEQPCFLPFVPKVRNQGGKAVFECAAADGLSGLPKDSTVDFGFSSHWKDGPDVKMRKLATLKLDQTSLLWALKSGDFDGDGKEELLAAVIVGTSIQGAKELRTYKLAGAKLELGSTTPLGADIPYLGPTGDFDGDGKADLLMANTPPVASGAPAALLLARSTGAGFSFGAPTEPGCYFTEGGDLGILTRAGDFDGDGKRDVAVLAIPCDGSDLSYTVTIRLGGVGAPVPIMKGMSMFAADLDKDGKTDLVVNPAAERYAAYINKGGMSFVRVQPDGVFFEHVTGVADLTGDGVVDLFTTDPAEMHTNLVRYAGLGNGDFGPASPPVPLSNPVCLSPLTGDIDGDGKLDVICASYSISVALGSGAVLTMPSQGIPGPYGNVTVVDLDGDGRSELVTFSGQTIEVWGLK